MPLIYIFCAIDDFCKTFEQEKSSYGISKTKKRNRKNLMSLSEIMTILIFFHFSGYKTFKDFYFNCICKNYRSEFPKRLSYTRFVALKHLAFMPIFMFLMRIKGKATGKYYIDSTKLPICHNLRISRNKVFKGVAQRGKTTTGWFFGFKLHIVINESGEIMSFYLTPGNVDDRKTVNYLTQNLKGWLFADRGYLSQKLEVSLYEKGIELITKTKKNMKKKVIDPLKSYYLNKRNIIETVFDQLKNTFTIDHSRYRSVMSMQINVLSCLLSYFFKSEKPSLKI